MPIVNRYRTQGIPKNRYAVDPAQSAIKALAPVIQEQYNNAFAVNSYPVLVFQRLASGRICSCSQTLNENPTVPAVQLYDEAGNASEATIKTLTTGFQYEIKRYASRDKQTVGNQVLEPADINPNERPFHNGTALDDEFAGRIDTDDFHIIDSPLTMGANVCGICFATGIVGGFALFGGNRIILDATAQPTLSKAFIDRKEHPFKLSFEEDDGSVEFLVTIPIGIYSILNIRVFDNTKEISAPIQIWDATNSIWVAVNASNLLTYATGLPIRLQVLGTTSTPFTHLEIAYLSTGTPLYADYPRLNNTGDLTAVDAIDPVSLNISPLLNGLRAYDCVYDVIQNRLWRVTSVTDFFDRNRNPHGWDCQARYIQPYENMAQLVSKQMTDNLYVNLPRRLSLNI